MTNQNETFNIGFTPLKDGRYFANISVGENYVSFKKLPKMIVEFQKEGKDHRAVITNIKGQVFDIKLMSDFDELRNYAINKIISIAKSI